MLLVSLLLFGLLGGGSSLFAQGFVYLDLAQSGWTHIDFEILLHELLLLNCGLLAARVVCLMRAVGHREACVAQIGHIAALVCAIYLEIGDYGVHEAAAAIF